MIIEQEEMIKNASLKKRKLTEIHIILRNYS